MRSIYRSKSPSNYVDLAPQLVRDKYKANLYSYSDPYYSEFYHKAKDTKKAGYFSYQTDFNSKSGFDRYYTARGYDMYRNINYGILKRQSKIFHRLFNRASTLQISKSILKSIKKIKAKFYYRN